LGSGGGALGSSRANPPSFPPGRGRSGDPCGDDLRAIAKTIVKSAKGGDLPAIRELPNRVIGKAPDDAEASPSEVIVVRTGVTELESDRRR
jgi:hypothetical protein